jgi:hypothetical protein
LVRQLETYLIVDFVRFVVRVGPWTSTLVRVAHRYGEFFAQPLLEQTLPIHMAYGILFLCVRHVFDNLVHSAVHPKPVKEIAWVPY